MVHRLFGIVAFIAVLAACGGQPAAQPTVGPTSAPAVPTSAPAATNVGQPTAAPVPSAVANPADFPRTLQDFNGSVTIDAQPKRVVALNQIALQYLVPFLGEEVVLVGYAQRDRLLPALAAAVEGLPSYDAGDLGAANLELLLRWKPDIAFASIASDYYSPVEQVTTVVNLPPARADSWRESTLMIGAALGLEERAEAIIAEADALIAAAATTERRTLAIAYVYNPGLVSFQTDVTPLGRIIEALGYDVAAPADPASQGFEEISLELAAERLDVDRLLVLNYGPEAVDGILNEPVLAALPVIAEGRYSVTTSEFADAGTSFAPATAAYVLDQLGLLLTQSAPESTAEQVPAFPVTIAHKYGDTTIPAAPVRIVTVGLTEQDVLLALGITPVGTTEWFGEHPGAIWPWAKDKLNGPVPTVVGDAAAVNFEQIAALKPDLILALYAGVTQEQYDLLAQIAPTVAQPASYVDYGIPWQELTRTVGLAVGKAAEADALVADVEARFADVREQHPEFVGASAVVATPYEGIYVYGPEDVRGRFLTALGFTLPAGLAEVTGAEFGGNLSMERADLLNVDVIIWLDSQDATGPLGGPLYASLPVHTEGREIFLSSSADPLGGATSFVSVLSLPFLLDGLVPQMTAAVDGDPATEVTKTP